MLLSKAFLSVVAFLVTGAATADELKIPEDLTITIPCFASSDLDPNAILDQTELRSRKEAVSDCLSTQNSYECQVALANATSLPNSHAKDICRYDLTLLVAAGYLRNQGLLGGIDEQSNLEKAVAAVKSVVGLADSYRAYMSLAVAYTKQGEHALAADAARSALAYELPTSLSSQLHDLLTSETNAAQAAASEAAASQAKQQAELTQQSQAAAEQTAALARKGLDESLAAQYGWSIEQTARQVDAMTDLVKQHEQFDYSKTENYAQQIVTIGCSFDEQIGKYSSYLDLNFGITNNLNSEGMFTVITHPLVSGVNP